MFSLHPGTAVFTNFLDPAGVISLTAMTNSLFCIPQVFLASFSSDDCLPDFEGIPCHKSTAFFARCVPVVLPLATWQLLPVRDGELRPEFISLPCLSP